jgi:uncharacterized protein (TIGR02001 family)
VDRGSCADPATARGPGPFWKPGKVGARQVLCSNYNSKISFERKSPIRLKIRQLLPVSPSAFSKDVVNFCRLKAMREPRGLRCANGRGTPNGGRAVGKGLTMRKVLASVVAAVALATPALAADMITKAKPVVAPPPSPWDFAFGSSIGSDYIWRGVTQSNHRASVSAYFEPRYNFNENLQGYIGLSSESISFPNRAAAEVDIYAGIRPTFGKLALDFGFWDYYYPGGQCFSGGTFTGLTGVQACNTFSSGGNFQGGPLPNGNVTKANVSFWEVYGKATYTVNDNFSFGGSVYYSPSVLNSGANGTYLAGTAKVVFPTTMLPPGLGVYASGDVGYWWLGTSDAFYGIVSSLGSFPNGINYKDYANWDLGFGFTWKVFTLDLRYYDTNLNKGDCNAFTSDHTAGGLAPTPINGFGASSRWCSAWFVAKLSADLTLANLK